MNILLIDNFDSFTFNLADEFEKRNCSVITYRNNLRLEEYIEIIKKNKIKLIVISPGGFIPTQVPVCGEIIKEFYSKIPIFGVCLGYECIVEALGGKITKAPSAMHGKSSLVYHDGKSIFCNITNPTKVGRYHSQMGVNIPDCFEISCRTQDNIIMGIRHRDYPIEGVLFHPESILTPHGGLMMQNLIERVKDAK